MAMRKRRWLAAILAAAILALWAPAARAGTPTLEEELRGKAEAAIKAGTLGAFRQEVGERLKKLLNQPGALTQNAAQLETLEHYYNVSRLLDFKADAETGKFLVWLLGQRVFCSRLLHALEPSDSPPKAVEVLRRLKAVKGIDEARYLQHQEMLIAFARVWDTYQWLWWTSVVVPEDRLEEIYQHYMTYSPAMQIPPDRLPHELLVFVIDHPLTKEEREYALGGFRGCTNLGKLFFDILWTTAGDSLYQGRNKKIPYTLMNIKKYHGVCMEQAYYASCIAKCVGVPATYCRGFGQRGGHAWVGVLVNQGGNWGWDFASGRYSYDHYWKGEVYDPAFRRGSITDGEVAMTAGLVPLGKAALESADAQRNLAVFILSGFAGDAQARMAAPTRGEDGEEEAPRGAAAASGPELPALTAEQRQLVHDLLASSAQLNPYSRRTWHVIGLAAAKGAFNLQEIQAFSDHLFRSVDRYSSDFVCHTVQRFLAAVKDEAARDGLYEVCFAYFRKRPDLAAELKVAQGKRREADGKTELALKAYLEAVASFPKDGHVTQEAARSIDAILAKGEPKKAVETLIAVWRSMEQAQQGNKPEEREAMRIMGENLLKYMKLAGMDKELAAFEAAFRQMFPPGKR